MLEDCLEHREFQARERYTSGSGGDDGRRGGGRGGKKRERGGGGEKGRERKQLQTLNPAP